MSHATQLQPCPAWPAYKVHHHEKGMSRMAVIGWDDFGYYRPFAADKQPFSPNDVHPGRLMISVNLEILFPHPFVLKSLYHEILRN